MTTPQPPGQARLAGRRALVVGAATGIGRATAIRLAAEGAGVVIADINAVAGPVTADRARQAAWPPGGQETERAWFLAVDVADEDSVREMARQAAELLGGLDIVVNCAGILHSVAEADVRALKVHRRLENPMPDELLAVSDEQLILVVCQVPCCPRQFRGEVEDIDAAVARHAGGHGQAGRDLAQAVAHPLA